MSKGAFETCISKKLLEFQSWFLGQYVSMSVSKHFFSKTADSIFLKFHMKLEWPKTKELTESDFSEKNPHFGE